MGLTADEATLGKPVCSDIREGKRTLLLIYAYQKSSSAEKSFIRDVVGKSSARDSQIKEVRDLIMMRGGVEYVNSIMETRIARAIENIEAISDSLYKRYLINWAEYLIGRSF